MQIDTLEDTDLSDWKSVLMIIITAFLILIALVGILVEYSSIGDKERTGGGVPLLESGAADSHLINPSTVPSARGNINGTEINGSMQSQLVASSSNQASIPPTPVRPSDPMERKGACGKCLLSFSLTYNLKRFVTRGREASPLDALDGVRVLSIFWVILGHSYFFNLQQQPGVRNTISMIPEFYKEFFFTVVTSGVLAVDSFFFMSAFLGAYIFLVKAPK